MRSGARSTRARRSCFRAAPPANSSRALGRSTWTGSGYPRSPTSRGIFPCTDYVRGRSELDYTPAPDCFHDIFGHTPMIMHPRFANFYQKIGRAALNCRDAIVEESLTRIYWFTVEFGLVRNPEGLRIYGNGIISSYAETQFSLTSQARKRPFIAGDLFVVDSFEVLESSFDDWSARNGLA